MIFKEALQDFYFYRVTDPQYQLLRYVLILAVYFLFSKDVKSLAHMFLMARIYRIPFSIWFCYFRALTIIVNETIMLSIICCANIAEQRALGYIVNFSAVMIICELDDIVMATGSI